MKILGIHITGSKLSAKEKETIQEVKALGEKYFNAAKQVRDLEAQLAEREAEIEDLKIRTNFQTNEIVGLLVVRDRNESLMAENQKLREIVRFLRWLEDETCDLRCVDVPTGGDDYDIGWRVIEHREAEPRERIIGFGETPIKAIKDAIALGDSE